ncbi:GNAT family N-acetyltransferase [Microlunatus speluncae]|uniref:GNAT family N-acetyltransferase n=1 Tax=Microlunatus speluncae TaxID=2594267 RepID=UPI0012661FF2|nr:GNAT family N-acetyltransferase [Microlunatus speluncae]
MPTDSGTIMIRDAVATDAARVAELLTQLGAPGVDAAEAGRRLGRGEERVLVAVGPDGVVTGLVAAKADLPFGHAAPMLRISALICDAERRREGAAQALIISAKQLARRLGCTGIELTCGLAPERAAAHRFYPEQGFAVDSYRYWWASDAEQPGEEAP